MLQSTPGLRPIAVYDEMLRRHPDLAPGFRRTLERRVRHWQALHGPERDVIFRQDHPPGQQSFSDFTDAADLSVTIAGEPLPHRLYHIRLAFSGWEHGELVLGGESFTALAQALLLRGTADFGSLPDCRRFGDEVIGHANARRRKLSRSSAPSCNRCRPGAPPTMMRLWSPSAATAAACSTPCPPARPPTGWAAIPRQRWFRPHPACRGLPPRHPCASPEARCLAQPGLPRPTVPRDAYRRTCDRLIAAQPPRMACRIMVGLLALAHERGCEADLAGELDRLTKANALPDLAAVQTLFAPDPGCIPDVTVTLPLPAFTMHC